MRSTIPQPDVAVMGRADGLAWSMLGCLPGVSMVTFDRQLRVVACDGDRLWSSGFERGSVVGSRLSEILTPAGIDVYTDHCARALAGEASTVEIETADGEHVYAIGFFALRPPDGSNHAGVAVSRDVTEVRAGKSALARSEQLRRELTDELRDFQARLGPHGDIRFVSLGADRVLGYPPAQLTGRSMSELMHPDDRVSFDASFAQRADAEGVLGLEVRLIHRDGSYRWCEATLRSVRDPLSDAVLEWQCAIRDITERREIEDQRWRWEQTFDCTTRGICISNASTDLIELVNPAFAQMHGGSVADFVGRPISMMLTDEKKSQLPQTLGHIDSEDFVRVESEHVRLDGSAFPVMAEVLLARDRRGRLLSRISWYVDLTEQRVAEAASREATETYETAFTSAPMGVALIAFDGRVMRANAALCEMLGRDESEIVGSTTESYTHPDDLTVTAQAFAHLTTRETPLSVQKRYLRPDGEVVWAQTRGTAVTDSRQRPGYIISHFHDITAIKVAELRQAEATARFETAFADAPIGMAIVSLDGRLVRVNRIVCQLSGYTEAQLLGLTADGLVHPDDRPANLERTRRLLAGDTARYAVEQRLRNAAQQLVWTTLAVSLVRDPDGRPLHFIAQIEDISERKQLEARLQHLADHDPLTAVWNRRRFTEELDRQIARCHRYREQAALLLIDLDGFKKINDNYGHKAGDDLLREVADAVRNRLRVTDSISRLGGDEFAVILTDVSLAQAGPVAASIRRTIAETSIAVAGVTLSVTASLGIAALDDEAANDQAYVQADAALYRDKNRAHTAHADSVEVLS